MTMASVKPVRETVKVISQEKLASDVYSLWLETSKIAGLARAGQFVSVYCKDGANLLPRPISICEVEGSKLRLVYRVVGKGTNEFSHLVTDDTVVVTGPLGNGYELFDEDAILIGGGIGIPPMLQLAKSLNCKKEIVVGYRDELFLDKELAQFGRVTIATEDGSVGTKGNVLMAIEEQKITGKVIYACGPMPMLRAVKKFSEENGMECFISLEEKMACGIGACLACVCKTKEKDEHSQVNNARICKEGPVFNAKEVEI
ncbi:MAG: dihydroorotate dehydrogenase electron transfer subunit [Lachnospiraceae bacterium]